VDGGSPGEGAVPGTIGKPAPQPPEAAAPPATPPPVETAVLVPPKSAEPAPAPKVEVAAAAPVSREVKTLQDVRRIYVEKMPNRLDEYIRSEIEKQLLGRVRLAGRREDADAVFEGDIDSNADAENENVGSATLTGSRGNVVLWKAEVAGKSSLWGIVKRGGPKKMAERLVEDLRKKMNY
jgi:hypothetical protein